MARKKHFYYWKPEAKKTLGNVVLRHKPNKYFYKTYPDLVEIIVGERPEFGVYFSKHCASMTIIREKGLKFDELPQKIRKEIQVINKLSENVDNYQNAESVMLKYKINALDKALIKALKRFDPELYQLKKQRMQKINEEKWSKNVVEESDEKPETRIKPTFSMEKKSLFARLFGKEEKKQELFYLISEEENTVDIVTKYPVRIQGEWISEFNFSLDYYFEWLKKRGMNIRVENKWDSIAESRSQTVRTVDLEEYISLTEEQIKHHIHIFLNDYQKTINYDHDDKN